MPRLIEETWSQIGFDVLTEMGPVVDPKDGQPLHDAHGLPKMQTFTTLVLILQEPTTQRIVKIPFAEDAKQTLLMKLPGGIIVPPTNGGLQV